VLICGITVFSVKMLAIVGKRKVLICGNTVFSVKVLAIVRNR